MSEKGNNNSPVIARENESTIVIIPGEHEIQSDSAPISTTASAANEGNHCGALDQLDNKAYIKMNVPLWYAEGLKAVDVDAALGFMSRWACKSLPKEEETQPKKPNLNIYIPEQHPNKSKYCVPSWFMSEAPDVFQCGKEENPEKTDRVSCCCKKMPKACQCGESSSQQRPCEFDKPPSQPRPCKCDEPPPQPRPCKCDQPPSQLRPCKCDEPPSQPRPCKCDEPPSQPRPCKCDQPPSQLRPCKCDQPPSQLRPCKCDQPPSQPRPCKCGETPSETWYPRQRSSQQRLSQQRPSQPSPSKCCEEKKVRICRCGKEKKVNPCKCGEDVPSCNISIINLDIRGKDFTPIENETNNNFNDSESKDEITSTKSSNANNTELEQILSPTNSTRSENANNTELEQGLSPTTSTRSANANNTELEQRPSPTVRHSDQISENGKRDKFKTESTSVVQVTAYVNGNACVCKEIDSFVMNELLKILLGPQFTQIDGIEIKKCKSERTPTFPVAEVGQLNGGQKFDANNAQTAVCSLCCDQDMPPVVCVDDSNKLQDLMQYKTCQIKCVNCGRYKRSRAGKIESDNINMKTFPPLKQYNCRDTKETKCIRENTKTDTTSRQNTYPNNKKIPFERKKYGLNLSNKDVSRIPKWNYWRKNETSEHEFS